MDLSLTEEQTALRDLARQIFDGHCTDDRLRELEAGPERHDPALWAELARAGVLGIGIPEEDGGISGGILEACAVLIEAGRATAPVPLWAALTGKMTLARFGTDEQRARHLPGDAPVVPALEAELSFVPAVEQAAAVLVPIDGELHVVERGAVRAERQQPTGVAPVYRVTLDGHGERLGDGALAFAIEHGTVAVCALQVGIASAALELTAGYLSEREQFGKPIGTFQAVQQRAADAYIDVEAMRWTMWEAAWRLSEGLPAGEHVSVAKVWAADGGARVLAAAQHLHGGIGVDLDYPLHRYTFAARQAELALGGAGSHLQRIAEALTR